MLAFCVPVPIFLAFDVSFLQCFSKCRFAALAYASCVVQMAGYCWVADQSNSMLPCSKILIVGSLITASAFWMALQPQLSSSLVFYVVICCPNIVRLVGVISQALHSIGVVHDLS